MLGYQDKVFNIIITTVHKQQMRIIFRLQSLLHGRISASIYFREMARRFSMKTFLFKLCSAAFTVKISHRAIRLKLNKMRRPAYRAIQIHFCPVFGDYSGSLSPAFINMSIRNFVQM